MLQAAEESLYETEMDKNAKLEERERRTEVMERKKVQDRKKEMEKQQVCSFAVLFSCDSVI